MSSALRARCWLEFTTADAAVRVARRLHELDMAPIDAFTPYSVPELESLTGAPPSRALPWLGLAGAIAGGGGAFALIVWTASVDYPLDVGGRPLSSLPADIPIVFETAVLFSALTLFVSVLLFCGMPRLHHPLESVPGFRRTSIDRFFLGLRGDEDALNSELRAELLRMGALHIHAVPT